MKVSENHKTNLVSVIIPAYNAGKFIAATIQSVLDQDHPEIELIIVNDGSEDNTDHVVMGYLTDPRIQYVFQKNAGCSAAKNTGLRLASGNYIQYLDADDLLSKDKIREQVAVLKSERCAIAVCRTKSFNKKPEDAGSLEIDSEFLRNSDKPFEFILNLYGLNGKNGMIQPNAFLITREIADQIGAYDVSISPAPDEDGEYFCRAMLAADKIYFTEKGVNYYRKASDATLSLSKQVSYPYAKGALKSWQLITKHLLAVENSERVRRIMAGYFASFIYLYSQYKGLGKEAEGEISKLGLKQIPAAGGENFRKMSKWIGFHNALFVKNLASSLKKKV